jgi:predicted glycosyltransferase
MQVLILVTHLLGTGHLSRALNLARAFVAHGHTVDVVTGGMSVPHLNTDGITLHQLPPVRSDGVNFSILLTANDTVVDEIYLAKRQRKIENIFNTLQPDFLITELYPFGRRVLSSEFLHLLSIAKTNKKRLAIFSSIRDILAPPSKPSKATKADQIIAQYYDGVFVHSDPATTPLDQSWPVSKTLAKKLHYTGYVAPAHAGPHPDLEGQNEIIVSAGGGSVGKAIFECAIDAASLDTTQDWRILVGGSNSDSEIKRLQKRARSNNLVIESARPDFRNMLHHATCSVSMCGYNTALDLMQAGTPSVFIPFDEGGEVEQTLRANSLAKHPGFSILAANDLTPQSLIKSIHAVQTVEGARITNLEFDGANETVRIATNWLNQV